MCEQKSIRPEDAIQKALEEMARDIVMIEPDPQDWAGWVNYLLDKMGEEAQKRMHVYYKEMLRSFKQGIDN
jgi:exoribonuclease II